MTDLTKVKARGIPQHVIDKLDLPPLTAPYFWKLTKPRFRSESYLPDHYEGKVKIKKKLRIGSYTDIYDTVTALRNLYTVGTSNAIKADKISWAEAFNIDARILYDKWIVKNRGYATREMANAAEKAEIEELWSK